MYIMMIIIERKIGAKDLLLYTSLLDSMFQLLNNFINQREWLIITMGILGLAKLIADIAPNAIKEQELKHYFGMNNLEFWNIYSNIYQNLL